MKQLSKKKERVKQSSFKGLTGALHSVSETQTEISKKQHDFAVQKGPALTIETFKIAIDERKQWLTEAFGADNALTLAVENMLVAKSQLQQSNVLLTKAADDAFQYWEDEDKEVTLHVTLEANFTAAGLEDRDKRAAFAVKIQRDTAIQLGVPEDLVVVDPATIHSGSVELEIVLTTIVGENTLRGMDEFEPWGELEERALERFKEQERTELSAQNGCAMNAWLKINNMEQYIENFASAELDLEDARELTEKELKEDINISKIGARKKLMRLLKPGAVNIERFRKCHTKATTIDLRPLILAERIKQMDLNKVYGFSAKQKTITSNELATKQVAARTSEYVKQDKNCEQLEAVVQQLRLKLEEMEARLQPLEDAKAQHELLLREHADKFEQADVDYRELQHELFETKEWTRDQLCKVKEFMAKVAVGLPRPQVPYI
jgi:hypothetical protein